MAGGKPQLLFFELIKTTNQNAIETEQCGFVTLLLAPNATGKLRVCQIKSRSEHYEPTLQRFSELCENWRALSHQLLTVKTDRPEATPEIMNCQTGKRPDVGTDIVA